MWYWITGAAILAVIGGACLRGLYHLGKLEAAMQAYRNEDCDR